MMVLLGGMLLSRPVQALAVVVVVPLILDALLPRLPVAGLNLAVWRLHYVVTNKARLGGS